MKTNKLTLGLCLAPAIALAALLVARPSHADVLASSTFDVDREDWVIKDLPFPNPGAPPTPLGTFVPTHNASGGNPNGHVSSGDPSGNAWYWHAPAKFLGTKSAAYGGTLSFDLAVTGSGMPFSEEDIIIVGGGVTLVLALPVPPGTSFTSYSVPLVETGWKRDSVSGAAATAAEMQTVLSALTNVYIRGEYLLNLDDVGRIDNVVLEAPDSAVCDVQLTQTVFVDGELVAAPVFRWANLSASPLAIEFKVWLEVPGSAPISVTRGGENGSVVLPAGFDQNFGPVTLFTVGPLFPRGFYAFSCRFLEPVTGAIQAEDLNAFEIR